MSESAASNAKLKRSPDRVRRAAGSGVHRRARRVGTAAKPLRVLFVPPERLEATEGEGPYRIEAEGFEVETVSSGAAALELILVDGKFALVVCAARMSDVTACEFLETLRWVVPGRRPPVVVFGQSNRHESARTIDLGALRCLPEDCGPRTLARELSLLVQSGALRPNDDSGVEPAGQAALRGQPRP